MRFPSTAPRTTLAWRRSAVDQTPEEDAYLRKVTSYLWMEESGYRSLRTFFDIQIVISIVAAIAIAIPLLANLDRASAGTEAAILLSALPNIVGVAIYFWLAAIFAKLTRAWIGVKRTESEYTLSHRKRMDRMSEDILEKAQGHVANYYATSHGNSNMVFVAEHGRAENFNQQSRAFDRETGEALALLLAYTREAGSADAESAAADLVDEAQKETPDRARIFDLWNRIAAALPDVLNIVKIVTGVRSIM